MLRLLLLLLLLGLLLLLLLLLVVLVVMVLRRNNLRLVAIHDCRCMYLCVRLFVCVCKCLCGELVCVKIGLKRSDRVEFNLFVSSRSLCVCERHF